MKTTLPLMLLATFVALSFSSSAFAEDLTAQQIIDKSLDRNSMGFQSGKAQLKLTIEDAAGSNRVRELEVKSKQVSEKARTLVTLTAPKEVRGQAFLFAEQEGEDDVWMYLPAFSVTRRIEGGQKNGAFLGSHFTYADLESRDLKDGEYKKLADEKIGKYPVYVIEATPKKGSASDYTKVVTYIRKSDFIPMKVKFFGKGDKVEKTMFVEKLDKTKDGDTYVQQMTIRPDGGGFTRIEIGALDSTDLPDSIFAKDQLGK